MQSCSSLRTRSNGWHHWLHQLGWKMSTMNGISSISDMCILQNFLHQLMVSDTGKYTLTTVPVLRHPPHIDNLHGGNICVSWMPERMPNSNWGSMPCKMQTLCPRDDSYLGGRWLTICCGCVLVHTRWFGLRRGRSVTSVVNPVPGIDHASEPS